MNQKEEAKGNQQPGRTREGVCREGGSRTPKDQRHSRDLKARILFRPEPDLRQHQERFHFDRRGVERRLRAS